MSYYFNDYASVMGPWTDQLYTGYHQQAEVNRQYEMTNTSRYHPYGRTQQTSANIKPYDLQDQYQKYFDYNSQFPVYDDAHSDVTKTAMFNAYPSTMNYNYPNLNFLGEMNTKSVDLNMALNMNDAVSQEMLQSMSSRTYPDFGQNYNYAYSFGANRRVSPVGVGPTRTRDKYRIVYTDAQKVALEEEYEKTSFITETRRAELAEEINLSERQIKFWFQNRRVKDRRGKTSKSKTKTVTGVPEKRSEKSREKQGKENIDVGKRIPDLQELEDLPPCRFSTKKNKNGCQRNNTDEKAYTIPTVADGCRSEIMYGRDLQGSRLKYPVSPSEWNGLSETSLLTTINVSPILSSVENDARS